ncbi:NACHT domain-containing protein [Streptomyces coeruleorubidus]|uniref:NACHT domain-containing protein n=1 Tax=Streptomyces coeruleorubidus TaxID=116188 RepID=UPI0036994EC5
MSADSPQPDAGASASAPKGGVLPKLSWLAAILLPPSVVAGVWRDVVRDHFLLACGVFAAYWLLLVAGRFAGEFVRDLVMRRRDGWLDSADGLLARRFSRFGRTYAEYVAASLRFMDQKGLATIGHYAPELDDVYVDVSLDLRPPGSIPADLLADPASLGHTAAGSHDRRSIEDFLDRPEPSVLAIVGAPGTGKTTLLRHTARRACIAPEGRRRGVPVLLYLRNLVQDLVDDPRVPLATVVRAGLGRHAAEEPPGWFEDRLANGACVVLLDGLDEVADLEARQTVVDWVERQIKEYPGNDYVITSRPGGYRSAPVEGATVLQTRRFTDGQVSTFVHSWYRAVERHAHREDSTDVELLAEEKAADLLARLRAAPSLYSLTVNPLLLTMIANVHRYRGALPGSRSDLYREICQVMLWRRQESKRLLVEPRGTQKETVLRELAFEMMRRRVTAVSRPDCTDILSMVLPRVSAHLTPEAFLEDVGTNGLLVERENGLFAFAHFTFQEYLAAEYIRDKGEGRLLAESVDDDWWRECTLLYAANADVGPVVRACLDSGTMVALALAFDCADEGNELDPGLRERLNDMLRRTSLAALDAEERRLMNGVLLTRRLRNTVRTARGGRLCASPVTWDTYDLFLRSSEEEGTPRVPDAPPEPGAPDVPVTGVRAEDAAAFASWVNGQVGGETRYRLPTREEIEAPGVQSLLCPPSAPWSAQCFWIAQDGDDQGAAPLWIRSGADDPRCVSRETLRTRIYTDLLAIQSPHRPLLILRARAAAAVAEALLRQARSLDLDLALAHVPALSAALQGVVEDGVPTSDELGLGDAAFLAQESARVRALPGELTEACSPEHLRVLPRLLAEDLVRELREVTRDGPDVTAVREVVSALEHDLRSERLRRRRIHEQLYQKVVDFDGPYPDPAGRRVASEDEEVRSLARARRSVYELAAGTVLPTAAARLSAFLWERRAVERPPIGTVLGDLLMAAAPPGEAPDDTMRFDPELIAQAVLDALPVVMARAEERTPHAVWIESLAHTVERLAVPLLRRQCPPRAEELRRARLAAVCLGAEAWACDVIEPTTHLYVAAAALTWLEDRHAGTAAAREALVLAVD